VNHLVTVCIPTYEMDGRGAEFLRQSFDILSVQTFKDFDVVVSDHSLDDAVRNVCEDYGDRLDIRYYRNRDRLGNSPANLNHAMSRASGKLIKVLFQDDFLFGPRALEVTVNAFDLEDGAWLVSASEHTRDDGKSLFYPLRPRYHDKIHVGDNTISSPSVLTVRADGHLQFDENLVLRMDCDYYKRCYTAFGPPKILNEITVVNRIGPHQISARMNSGDLKEREFAYILGKYAIPHPTARLLRFKMKRRMNRLKETVRLLLGRVGSPTKPHPERR
jgi:glycosyltransferase involved in cell wall biosynthesis